MNDFPQTLKRTFITAVLTAFIAATAIRLFTSRETQLQISHYLGITILALLVLAPVAWLLARHGWPEFFNDRPINNEPPPRPPPTKPLPPPSKEKDDE